MQSPRNHKQTLVRETLESGLSSFVCPATGGRWIDGETYWAWLRAQGEITPSRNAADSASAGEVVAINDADGALISPRSGRLMRKFRVGRGLRFAIDFDAASGGFWLDAGEYESLRAHNLHDELQLIASEDWQRELRRTESAESAERRLRMALGEVEYAKLMEVREWIGRHEQREVLVAALRWSRVQLPA